MLNLPTAGAESLKRGQGVPSSGMGVVLGLPILVT